MQYYGKSMVKKANLGKKYRHYIDTETTGLNPYRHELLEVAVVSEVVDPANPRQIIGDPVYWCKKILPQRLAEAEPKALEVNGYSPEKWADAVPFKDIARELSDILRDGIIVGHNVKFDIGFLEAAFEEAEVETRMGYHHIDTVTLAYERWGMWGETFSVSLDNIRKMLGIPVEGGHSALKDAIDCRTVFYQGLQTQATSTVLG